MAPGEHFYKRIVKKFYYVTLSNFKNENFMGLNALISIDLKTNSSEKINHFNEAMQEKEWSKIESMDHTWVSSFNDGISREKALEVIQSDVTTIKQEYDLETLSIAVQLSKEDIVQGDF